MLEASKKVSVGTLVSGSLAVEMATQFSASQTTITYSAKSPTKTNPFKSQTPHFQTQINRVFLVSET